MTAIRSIFLGLVAALFLFVFSFSFIVSWDGGDAGPFPYVALVVGLATLPLVRWVRAKPLVLNDAASLAGSWHTQLFIGVGVAELPALVGLVCAMLADVPWVYCIALPFGPGTSGGSLPAGATSSSISSASPNGAPPSTSSAH